jgi:hypothetical protein
MNLAVLPPIREEFRKQPLGAYREEREPTPAELRLLQEIQAKLSGLGEPPQLGNRVILADIQKAIRMSEIGEPYFMFALFRDMIQNDPHLQAMIGQRVMSFIGQPETIEPVDPKNAEDRLAAEFIEDIIANCENWREGIMHLAQGHIWPLAGAEKIYGRVEPEDAYKFRHPTTWFLRKLHPIPWPLFTYRVAYWNINSMGASDGGFGLFDTSSTAGHFEVPGMNGSQTGTNAREVLRWDPQDWHPDLRFYNTYDNGLIDWTMANCYKADKVRHVIHSAQVSTSGMKDNFGSILRSLIPIWFYKKSLLDWYIQKMERYGGPFMVATANLSNKNLTDQLSKSFKESSVIGGLLVPPGTKVELKEIQVSGMSDGFAKGIDLLNMEETKAICGQTMSTSDKGNGMSGGSGKAELQGEVKQEWTLFDKRSMDNTESGQIFSPILRLNGYRGRCRSQRGGLSAAALGGMANTFQKFAMAGAFIDESAEDELTKMCGIKMKVKDLQALAAQQQADKRSNQGDDK